MPFMNVDEPNNDEATSSPVTRPPANCRCESCKVNRFEDSKLRDAVIHTYSYQPENWKFLHTQGDPFSYYLGVELETDNYYESRNGLGGIVYSSFEPEIAADMRLPKRLWTPKRDSSVTGPEFASHPATLTYWRAKKPQLKKMFDMLLHAGYRSHDNGNCGMHVNISRTAFDNGPHLFRFLSLIHRDANWSRRMAQRSVYSMNQYAKLNWKERRELWSRHIETPAERDRRIRDESYNLMVQPSMVRQWAGSDDKYVAVNAPYGQARFEFRLPRGTLRIDRFFKNLEWTVAMIEFTRDAELEQCVPTLFMQWVAERKREYRYLHKFIYERFKKRTRNLKTVPTIPADTTTLESRYTGDWIELNRSVQAPTIVTGWDLSTIRTT